MTGPPSAPPPPSPAPPPSSTSSTSSPSSSPSAPPPPSPEVVGALRAAGCVFAEDEAALLLATAGTPAELAGMVDRRVAGLPLEHVLGWAEFYGLRMAVEPGVFVPRRRTEFLVGEAERLVRQAAGMPGARPVLLDLCCGSGALGAALATALRPDVPEVELYAADLDPASVRCARRNVAAVGGRVYEGDLFEPLPDSLRGRVEVLLANVPYVPTGEIALLPAEARVHEPLMSLDGGPDGLGLLRRVAAEAPGWLAPGGHLLFETTERQVPAAVESVQAAGLSVRVVTSEEWYATVVIATASPNPDRA